MPTRASDIERVVLSTPHKATRLPLVVWRAHGGRLGMGKISTIARAYASFPCRRVKLGNEKSAQRRKGLLGVAIGLAMRMNFRDGL
jgi:hypothetical protein